MASHAHGAAMKGNSHLACTFTRPKGSSAWLLDPSRFREHAHLRRPVDFFGKVLLLVFAIDLDSLDLPADTPRPTPEIRLEMAVPLALINIITTAIFKVAI